MYKLYMLISGKRVESSEFSLVDADAFLLRSSSERRFAAIVSSHGQRHISVRI